MPINAMQAAANNNKTSVLCSTFHAEPKYVFKNSLLCMYIRVIYPERFLTRLRNAMLASARKNEPYSIFHEETKYEFKNS